MSLVPRERIVELIDHFDHSGGHAARDAALALHELLFYRAMPMEEFRAWVEAAREAEAARTAPYSESEDTIAIHERLRRARDGQSVALDALTRKVIGR
jgi:hypothetical protein